MVHFSPRQNVWARALEVGLGTMTSFSLSETPTIGAECSVKWGGGSSLKVPSLASPGVEPLLPSCTKDCGPQTAQCAVTKGLDCPNSHTSPQFPRWLSFQSLIRHRRGSTTDTHTCSLDINRTSQFILFLPPAIRMYTFINDSLLTSKDHSIHLL